MTNSRGLKLVMILAILTYACGQAPNAFQAAKPANPQLTRPQAGLQQQVRCPVPEVRTEITTSLPKPWWNTPQVGKLESVSIEVIGGKKTLVCHYLAYGTKVSVMRLPPEGVRDCGTSGDHFVCR